MNQQKKETHLIDKAVSMAVQAHTGQTDRYGRPYILHALAVGLRGETDVEIVAGVLHDVVEDCYHSLEPLREAGFSEEIIAIVDALSKREEEEYDVYIDRVMQHPVAMKIKLRDLEQNMDLRRVDPAKGVKEERFNRYVTAWNRIRSRLSET